MLATLGLASGLVWALIFPRWTIASSDEIEIAGNRLLQEAAIARLLAWGKAEASTPLLLLDPQHLAARLQASAPLARVTVSRTLLPLGLTVTVVERPPVAATLPEADASPTDASPPVPSGQEGLLDATGVWLPKSAFTTAVTLPALQVRGYDPGDRARWQQLYAAIARAPFAVTAVDLQDPDNAILEIADLGPVHLGGALERLDQQLATAARLQAALPQHPRADRIAYIDLRNPDAPAVRPTPEKT